MSCLIIYILIPGTHFYTYAANAETRCTCPSIGPSSVLALFLRVASSVHVVGASAWIIGEPRGTYTVSQTLFIYLASRNAIDHM